MSNTL